MKKQNYLPSSVLKHWTQKKVDEYFMSKVLELAAQYRGLTNPNPMVGCIVVKDYTVVTEGVHKKSGKKHAEADALSKVSTNDTKGATLYSNLEPCIHLKKRTPPCLPLILNYKLDRVVICNEDPNPLVKGKSIRQLRKQGIKVTTGILKQHGLKLNEVFFYHIQNQKPFIHLKWAQTLDGKLAKNNGSSQWISNEKSRQFNQELRGRYDGIIVGSNTIKKDDPQLNLRIKKYKKKNYVPLIFSPKGKISFKSKIFEIHPKVVVVTEEKNVPSKYPEQVSFVTFKGKISLIKWNTILKELYSSHKLTSLYAEGGGQTLSLLIQYNSFQKLSVFIAPKILGPGKDLPAPDKKIVSPEDPMNSFALDLLLDHSRTFDQDLYLAYSNRKPQK